VSFAHAGSFMAKYSQLCITKRSSASKSLLGINTGRGFPFQIECRNYDHERAVRYLLDKVFHHLDAALDYVPCLTANMMRLERFSSWYDNEIYGKSKYLDELERIYKNAEGRIGNPWGIAELKWRLSSDGSLNPLSAKTQNRRIQLGENIPNPYNLGQEYPSCNSWRMRDWKRYICRKNFYDKLKILGIGLLNESHTQTRIDDLSIKDGWDPAEWHRLYPDGIPPLGRHLFIFEFEMGKWDDREFIEAPRSRFTGWDGAKYNWQSSYEMPMHEAMAWLRLENV
jgi:hypothetical protein